MVYEHNIVYEHNRTVCEHYHVSTILYGHNCVLA